MPDDEEEERERRPAEGWDYSSHPLKGGGTQIVAMVVGSVVAMLLLGILVVAWFLLSQHPAAR